MNITKRIETYLGQSIMTENKKPIVALVVGNTYKIPVGKDGTTLNVEYVRKDNNGKYIFKMIGHDEGPYLKMSDNDIMNVPIMNQSLGV